MHGAGGVVGGWCVAPCFKPPWRGSRWHVAFENEKKLSSYHSRIVTNLYHRLFGGH